MQHTFFKSSVILLLCLGFLTSLSGISQESNSKPVITNENAKPAFKGDISCWLTNPDKSALLQKQDLKIPFNAPVNQYPTITIDAATTYQEMDGFGIALTGGSASLITNLAPEIRDTLLRELFLNNDNSIGISYLRISIGASDLDAKVFSYNDLPVGETDAQLRNFDLGPDKVDLIPVLQAILKLNPKLKIMGSPWSAPLWMKSNKNSIGGSLLPEYYDAYAKYFVRYITEMKAQGITIDAITIQNEPLYGGNNPSMVMQATEQRDFIKDNLGPAFKAAGIKTKIILYDHNCDVPEYATDILSDSIANQYIDGSAFHLYGGDISALSKVHDAFPAKNVYFTEQWVGGPSKFGPDMKWYVQNVIIGSTRNWSKAVIEWNLASDSLYDPHTPGGCTSCEGAITISSGISRNVSYYTLAHASKFVPAGSVRIASNSLPTLPNVAFKTPDGRKVLIVLNNSDKTETFNIAFSKKNATTSLNTGSVATYVW
ncbi:MAG: glycoside hydrolase family 30 beta sandwich domain-containing protein [Bacteroidales bacterium]|nr:glycoside hydrolase family 30 beta sandwich domain-containing protein [Bacteroidales bacterium]